VADWAWLGSLSGLQRLWLECPSEDAGQCGWQPLAHALSMLTQLQRLVMCGLRFSVPLGPSWVAALPRLTHLVLSSTWITDLPADMGQMLPALEVLEVERCYLFALPGGFTRLTRLHAAHNTSLGRRHMHHAGLERLPEATALRQLDLSDCNVASTSYLAPLSGLEVLQLRGMARRLCSCITQDVYCGHCFRAVEVEEDPVAGPGMPAPPMPLPAAANLRHLDLSQGSPYDLGPWWVESLRLGGSWAPAAPHLPGPIPRIEVP